MIETREDAISFFENNKTYNGRGLVMCKNHIPKIIPADTVLIVWLEDVTPRNEQPPTTEIDFILEKIFNLNWEEYGIKVVPNWGRHCGLGCYLIGKEIRIEEL